MNRSLPLYRHLQLQPCPYLTGQESSNEFIDPSLELDQHELTCVNQMGFRRSGRILYRPRCPDCQACQSSRIPIDYIDWRKSDLKTLRRNRDLTLSVTMPMISDQHIELYRQYQEQRHQDHEKDHEQAYQRFLLAAYQNGRMLNAYHGDQLVAFLLFDLLDDGLSSVYSVYQLNQPKRSLGHFMILTITRMSLNLGLTYHYLGYYVQGSDKMRYKMRYQPLEILTDGHWQTIDDPR